tara:strand:+ start:50 stop:922 length:873 start_codon:yes stop_codon:yes gene_type:complete
MDRIDLKKNYESYSNEKIIDILKSSFNQLKPFAQDVLLDEIAIRQIKINGDNQLQNKIIVLQYYKKIDRLRKVVYSQKTIGSSDVEIINFLKREGITEQEAIKISNRLPALEPTSEDFNKLISKKAEQESSFEVAFILIIAFVMILIGAIYSKIMLIPAVALVITALFLYNKNSKTFEGGQFWIRNINSDPHDFVWLIPIRLDYKLYHILTVNQEFYFQLLLKNGDFLKIKLKTKEEKKIFFDGIKLKLPHIQFGYSQDINKLFNHNPENFLNSIESLGIYTPIDTINLN